MSADPKVRVIKDAPPEVAAEAALARSLPQVKPPQEEELKAEVMHAGRLYDEAAVKHKAVGDCTTAAAVLSSYLRHTVGVKAEVYYGIYVDESARVSAVLGKLVAVSASKAAKEVAYGTPEQPANPLKRNIATVEQQNPYQYEMTMKNIHAFVLIPRENTDGRGNFYYADLTHNQFGREGVEAEAVFDVVDAKKLHDKYGLVLWGPEAQRHIQTRGYYATAAGLPMPEEERISALRRHATVVHEILSEMLAQRKSA
ncbi:Uncharacterised protein [uncultured archaeon]|nr:Uncharacterised protein [uncultured archaeon]